MWALTVTLQLAGLTIAQLSTADIISTKKTYFASDTSAECRKGRIPTQHVDRIYVFITLFRRLNCQEHHISTGYVLQLCNKLSGSTCHDLYCYVVGLLQFDVICRLPAKTVISLGAPANTFLSRYPMNYISDIFFTKKLVQKI